MTEPSPGPATSKEQPSFYDLLGLRSNASVQDIRRAYRDLSKLYHPDTTELESAIATPKFQALNEAYATLSSPEKRLAYDYKLGFARISVMQPLSRTQSRESAADERGYSANAYINPSDRPLSAGEFFALFILGLTFIACLVLVFTLSLTRDDVQEGLDALTHPNVVPEVSAEGLTDQANSQAKNSGIEFLPRSPEVFFPSSPEVFFPSSPEVNMQKSSQLQTAPELPDVPWLVPHPKR